MNLEIVEDFSGLFSGFLIDLRRIKTATRLASDPPEVIGLFEKLLKGQTGVQQELKQMIQNTTSSQYRQGI